MKKHLLTLCFGLLLSPVVGNAGNMFGPAPFRNGSPLVTGVDGTYQATARAENITGIFRFAYLGGSQTASATQNSWIFFKGGLVMRGSVEAAIDGSNVSGILAQQSAQSVSTDTNSSLPLLIVTSTADSAGNFNGNINLKSPSGAFSGSGVLQSATAANYTYTIVDENSSSTNFVNTTHSQGFTNYFNFRGVRTSTLISGTSPAISNAN